MSVAFQPSTRFRQWMTQLRVSWMGRKAQAIMGAFAQVLGDYTYDWMVRANLEHLPEYANSAQSVALIGSERQIDQGPTESTAAYATRITYATQWWRFAGTPFGLLQALWFAGFGSAIIVTQNGLAFSLSQPPDASNPVACVTVTGLGNNPTLRSPHSWWTFDLNDPFCSRFSVLFYGIPPACFQTWGRAVFTGVEDGSGSHPWPTITWSNPFPTAVYNVLPGTPVVVDGGPPPVVSYDPATQTAAGVQVVSSAAFSGYVDYVAYQQGANPYADPHPSDLARLRSVIAKWKPAKATCVTISCCVQGRFNGWPVRDTSSGAGGVASTVVEFSAT